MELFTVEIEDTYLEQMKHSQRLKHTLHPMYLLNLHPRFHIPQIPHGNLTFHLESRIDLPVSQIWQMTDIKHDQVEQYNLVVNTIAGSG